MHERLIGELSTFLARNGLVDTTLAEHRCTPWGQCTCSTDNIKRPWPCTTYKGATMARLTVAASAAGTRRVG